MRLLILSFLTAIAFAPLSTGAQQPFDSVTVKRIKPEDLPSPEETVLPDVLQGAVLPKIPNSKDIDSMFVHTRDRMMEVVAEFPPVSSLQKTPLILSGHAVWLSAHEDGRDPILVTPAHWVENSRRIVVRKPLPREHARELPEAKRVSLSSVTMDVRAKQILDSTGLKIATVKHVDKHRNLATLHVEDFEPPKDGLTFFPMQRQSPTYLYGVALGLSSPRMATILPVDPRKTEIVFYLLTDFPISLGAAIVSPSRQLIAITAMPHPDEPHLSLIVPPLALKRYVETVQGILKVALEEDVETP